MKTFTTLLIFVLMSINVALAGVIPNDIANTIPNSALPACEDTGCYVIAEKTSLKEILDTDGVKIQTGLFNFTIPFNLAAINSHPSSALIVYKYKNAPNIIISTETYADYFLHGFTTKPPSIQAFLEIVYTKTPKDYDMTSTYDKESWNALMWFKKQVVGKNNKTYIYDKGRLKIYYETGVDRVPYKNAAWAIDSENPNLALRLESNMAEVDFRKILFSITSKTKEK